eukprot:jgi/Astpho2/2036/gw1.00038.406.1_t
MVAPGGHASDLCDMHRGSSRRPPGSAPVGTGAGLPLGQGHLCSCRMLWTLGDTEMG